MTQNLNDMQMQSKLNHFGLNWTRNSQKMYDDEDNMLCFLEAVNEWLSDNRVPITIVSYDEESGTWVIMPIQR